MNIRLDYFHYEPPEDATPMERLNTVAIEIESAVLRLQSVVDELQFIAEGEIDIENADSKFKYFGYHAEKFLSSVYELRERLISCVACLSSQTHEDLIGRGGYHKRLKALSVIEEDLPKAAIEIRNLEKHVC